MIPMQIRIKRAYEEPEKTDGYRILVDRLWPRGVSKEKLQVDWWARELAPSDELRRRFGHDPDKWAEFKKRYFRELSAKSELLAEVARRAQAGPATLVYGARDEAHNQAAALVEYLEGR
jgi:uncharacterized protein YeaO (DUF488 family)